MKYNKFMKAASVMTALALVTTFAISGSLAKFTSTVGGNDSASVAEFKFGVYQTEDVDAAEQLTYNHGAKIDLFGTSVDDTGIFKGIDTNNDDEKLVAPGVEGYFDLTFVNESEVAVAYTIDAFELVSKNADGEEVTGEIGDNDVPVIFYFNGFYYSDSPATDSKGADLYYYRHDGDMDNGVYVTIDGTIADLVDALNTYKYHPNGNSVDVTELYATSMLPATGTSENDTIELAWFWAYEVSKDGYNDLTTSIKSEVSDNNDKDGGMNGTTVELKVVVRATQMDGYIKNKIVTAPVGSQTWYEDAAINTYATLIK